MPEPLCTPENPEHLRRLVEVFNTSEMLRHFGARIAFVENLRTQAVVDPIEPFQRGGLQGSAVNGGMISSMVDLVVGLTGLARLPGGRSATAQLSINFLRPLTGPRLLAEGWVEKGGSSVLFAAAHVLDAQGTVCASATGVVRLIPGQGAIGGVPL